MSFVNIDPELLQDFLTESGELLEQLDKDLVELERGPSDQELLNQVFRALHTIKGSASFLALTNLVSVAHVAEGALNAARNRVITIDKGAMDLLLAAVDIIKRQFDEIRAGRPLSEADSALVAGLSRLADGKPLAPSAAPASDSAAPSTPSPDAPGDQRISEPADIAPPRQPAPSASHLPGGLTGFSERPLQLPANKADLLEYLVADLEATLDQVERQVKALSEAATRRAAAESLADVAEALRKSVDFFDFDSMTRLAMLFSALADKAPGLPEATVAAAVHEGEQVLALLRQQSSGLSKGKQLIPAADAIVSRFEQILKTDPRTDPLGASPTSGSSVEAEAAVSPSAPAAPAAPANQANQANHTGPGSSAGAAAAAQSSSTAGPSQAGQQAQAGGHAAGGDTTIRVEVSRLESLLNLVGELVLQKNRIGALNRQLSAAGWGDQAYREAASQTNSALDRVTSDLQVAVMKTRMQPLDKIFGKYPRLVRDLARKLNKQIELVIEGGQTEVDKSVIEELGDPLIHLMRNSADHGIESPERRVAAGKPAQGTIRLMAGNAGGHVEIRISDDGKGLDPKMIAAKAVEKGVITQAEADAMSDRDRMRLIFAPGFSTAEKLSDVSGRGVGMDVVRSNVEKIKGSIDLQSVVGQGATVIIKIPLTVAIMSSMLVEVGPEIYAVPLSNVLEIVKPTREQLSTINQHPVMRLRDSVLPLVHAGEIFGQPEQGIEAPFAVVVHHNDRRVGLLVSGLIGQQEIVIKPLDEFIDKGGPVSGATVRDDGGVSLIVDVPRLVQLAEDRQRKAA